MPRGMHGEKAKLWHIRLRNPKNLVNMRTVKRGVVKQVVGIDKKTKKWVEQNIMIWKKHARKKGNRLVVTNKKVRSRLKKMGIPLSKIFKRKNGGYSDYTIRWR